MKKIIFILLILIIPLNAGLANADEPQEAKKAQTEKKPVPKDTFIKIGLERLSMNFNGRDIMIPSRTVQFEHYVSKSFGIGFQFRKEGNLNYEGFHLGSYATYKTQKKTYLFANGGLEFGISSTIYNFYETQNINGYMWKRWSHINQPAIKNIVGVYPFGTIGLGRTLKKHFIFEGGVKLQVIRFGTHEALFAPDMKAYSLRDTNEKILIPSVVVRAGYKF